MLIRGYYRQRHNEPPAPHLRAVVLLPGIPQGKFVEFLVDTGADYTALHPRDAAALGVQQSSLDATTLHNIGGIGGTLQYLKGQAVFLFEPTLEGQDITGMAWSGIIDVCNIWDPETRAKGARLPSLLGRDFLNLFQLYGDESQNVFTLTSIPGRDQSLRPFTLPPSPSAS